MKHRPRPVSLTEILGDAFMVAGSVAGQVLDKLQAIRLAEERQAQALERMAAAMEGARSLNGVSSYPAEGRKV